MYWAQCMEQIFFTDSLDKYIKDFLFKQKLLSADTEAEKWRTIFQKINSWKQEYLIDSDTIRIRSFQMWYINMSFGTFLLPNHEDKILEDDVLKIFLIGWTLDIDDDEKERYMIRSKNGWDFDFELESSFEYSKKKCTWLSKEQFLEELCKIYSRSYKAFLYDKD